VVRTVAAGTTMEDRVHLVDTPGEAAELLS
jgi:hypothetical protein